MQTIKVTDYNTVLCSDFKELTVDDFLNKLNSNIDTGKGKVAYDFSKNKFIITYLGKKYVLELDEEVMQNYLSGKYNSVTLELKKMIKKTEKIEKNNETKKNQELAIKEKEDEISLIIKQAEKGIIPNEASKEIYLKYLMKQKSLVNIFGKTLKDKFGFVFSVVEKFLKNRKVDFILEFLTISSLVISGLNLSIAFGTSVVVAICGALLSAGSIVLFAFDISSSNNHERYIGAIPLSKLVGTVLSLGSASVMAIGETISQRRDIDFKIDNVSKMTFTKELDTFAGREFDKTLDSPKKNGKDNYRFKDVIMKNIDELLDRLDYINEEDRDDLLLELKNILTEYAEGMDKIERQELDATSLQLFNISFDLESTILNKISQVELKLLEVRKKDLEKMNRDEERDILMSKMQQLTSASTTKQFDSVDEGVIDSNTEKREKNKSR